MVANGLSTTSVISWMMAHRGTNSCSFPGKDAVHLAVYLWDASSIYCVLNS